MPNFPEINQIGLLAIHQPASCQFSLPIKDQAALLCQQVVRVVPGKRIVCKADWGGQSVFAKLFISQDAKRYAARDSKGVKRLIESGITTPALLYSGVTDAGSIHVLIFEAILNSHNAEDQLCQQDSEGRYALICKLVEAVAQHHLSGLMQKDLYARNFLLADRRIYTIDGDAVRHLPLINRQKTSIQNLAKLISNFDIFDLRDRLDDLIAIYLKINPAVGPIDAQKLALQVSNLRAKVVSAYSGKKVFRKCSDISVKQAFSYFVAVNRKYQVREIEVALSQPDALLSAKEASLLKQGNTCTVGTVTIANQQLVLKRYNIKNFWHLLGRILRKSRAAISWGNAYRLQMYGVATPNPVALLEKRWGYCRLQAYLLTEYLDAPDVYQYFDIPELTVQDKLETAHQIAKMFYKLKLLKISHGDMKSSNIKISKGQPQLIDLDSLREHRCKFWSDRKHIRDLRRFMLNWPNGSAVYRLLSEAFLDIYQDSQLLNKAGISIK